MRSSCGAFFSTSCRVGSPASATSAYLPTDGVEPRFRYAASCWRFNRNRFRQPRLWRRCCGSVLAVRGPCELLNGSPPTNCVGRQAARQNVLPALNPVTLSVNGCRFGDASPAVCLRPPDDNVSCRKSAAVAPAQPVSPALRLDLSSAEHPLSRTASAKSAFKSHSS